ncbi:MAG: TasA family protein [Minisyncoccia bacterium]
MNKKIILSLGVIGIVAAFAIGGTVAYFSDTETSTGNTFTAGAIDLKIDSKATYNGVIVDSATWQEKDLIPTADKFFNFADVKPGDIGEDTISLHVINNDAWVCAEVKNLTSAENSCNDPELEAEPQCAVDSVGELQDNLVFTIWKDDGVANPNGGEPTGKCDNIHQDDETILLSGHPVNGVLPLYDSTTGSALLGGTTTCLGVGWTLPAETGNAVQTDSMTGDISFNVVQARNNDSFKCIKEYAFVLTDPSEQNVLNTVSLDKPWYTQEIKGLCIDFTLHNPTYSPAYFDFAIDGASGSDVPGLSNIMISEGPLNGQLVGNLYSNINVPKYQTTTVTKCGTNEIKMAIHFGAEQLWYLDWATFTAKEV